MRKIAFFLLVILQIIIIGVLVMLFEQIDVTGEEITVVSIEEEDYYYHGLNDPVQHIYKRYNISQVPKDKWNIDEELTYQDFVYVTLTKNEQNIHEIKSVSLEKPKAVDSDDVIVKAKYDYYDDKGFHQLTYGFEFIEDVDRFGSFKEIDQIKVTILLGKLGQQKIKNVVKIESE